MEEMIPDDKFSAELCQQLQTRGKTEENFKGLRERLKEEGVIRVSSNNDEGNGKGSYWGHACLPCAFRHILLPLNHMILKMG